MARTPVYRGTHLSISYEPDRRSIAKCAVGDELTEAVTEIVHKIARPFAIGISPYQSGEYKKSFIVQRTVVVMGAEGYPLARVCARLLNISDYAATIEWGRRGRKGQHILGQTLDLLDATSR